ncbi:MAG: helix-turn-helix transcriptional regulator [Ferruginibacter sp.]
MKTIKLKKKKSGIEELRSKLGLSQEKFAEKLGISRSLVNMAENGRRTLPTHALLKFIQLEKISKQQ